MPYKFHQLCTQLHQVQPHKCFFVHYIWVRLFLGCIPGGVKTINPVSDWTDSHKEVRHHSFCCFLQVDSKFAKENTSLQLQMIFLSMICLLIVTKHSKRSWKVLVRESVDVLCTIALYNCQHWRFIRVNCFSGALYCSNIPNVQTQHGDYLRTGSSHL